EVKKKKVAPSCLNPLDRTIIHPESYDIAEKFLKELKVDPENIGQQILVNKVTSYMRFTRVEDVANKLSSSAEVIQLILDAFKQLQDYDIRKGRFLIGKSTYCNGSHDTTFGKFLQIFTDHDP
ncbi:hypothetical protein AVEN_73758-1, partial [Araneus ventricosus]